MASITPHFGPAGQAQPRLSPAADERTRSPMRTELIVFIVSLALLAFASQQLMAAKAVIGAVVGG